MGSQHVRRGTIPDSPCCSRLGPRCCLYGGRVWGLTPEPCCQCMSTCTAEACSGPISWPHKLNDDAEKINDINCACNVWVSCRGEAADLLWKPCTEERGLAASQTVRKERPCSSCCTSPLEPKLFWSLTMHLRTRRRSAGRLLQLSLHSTLASTLSGSCCMARMPGVSIRPSSLLHADCTSGRVHGQV